MIKKQKYSFKSFHKQTNNIIHNSLMKSFETLYLTFGENQNEWIENSTQTILSNQTEWYESLTLAQFDICNQTKDVKLGTQLFINYLKLISTITSGDISNCRTILNDCQELVPGLSLVSLTLPQVSQVCVTLNNKI